MIKTYADYNSTYPCSDSHLDTLTGVIRKVQGNPSSVHNDGRTAKLMLEESREYIGQLFGADRRCIYFTSGATEANNLAIHGFVQSFLNRSRQSHLPKIIISQGEHPSVTLPCERLFKAGKCELAKINLKPNGAVNTEQLLSEVNDQTNLVCLIYANNEVGTINDIEMICEDIKKINPNVHMHVDAVQALGKLDVSWVGGSKIDSMAVSAHKIGGLKGVGCLYLKPESKLEASIFGGGQEGRLRSGTENMPGIISFGLRAKDILAKPKWFAGVAKVCSYFIEELSKIDSVVIHGDFLKSTKNTVNFHVENHPIEQLMLHLDLAGIAVSSGSACSSGASTPSAVLLNMGYSSWVASNSIRVSFGASSGVEDVDRIVSVIKQTIGGP